jgi:hypothetical protein
MTQTETTETRTTNWYDTQTIRYKCPEATVFVSVIRTPKGPRVHVYAGKAGTECFALADSLARAVGLALQKGLAPEVMQRALTGISHQRTVNGPGFDAASIGDAIAKALDCIGAGQEQDTTSP